MDYHQLTKKAQQEAIDRGFVPMFASRDSMVEAHDYLNTIVDSLESPERIAIITAMQVLENTKIMVTMEAEIDDILLME